MLKIDYNPLRKQWNERMEKLPDDVREAVQAFCNQGPAKGENFKVIKRTRRQPNDGDIFVCTINGTVYYYGKILKACIVNPSDEWINGCILACLFRDKTTVKNLDNYKGSYDNLLLTPFIVTKQYWTGGWFETIGNVPLDERDFSLDYGFYEAYGFGPMGGFYKETGEGMDHIPKYMSSLGIETLIGVYRGVKREVIIDPSLLTMD